MLFEYTRLGKSYVITNYKDTRGDEIRFYFHPETSGTLTVGSNTFPVRAGAVTVKSNLVSQGIHTPLFKNDKGEEYICEKIRCEAGIIIPSESAEERSISLAGEVVPLIERLKKLEACFCELYEAVYGKTIF